MSRENRFLKNTVYDNEIYRESLPGVPLVEICDRRRVLIENHKGILAYGCKEILVKVGYGHIYVCGESLKVAKMNKEKLVIVGSIHSVCLRGRE